MTKGVITEEKSALFTEDPATPIKIEIPETYINDISGDNASDDANTITKCTCAAGQLLS